jgi:hypothetical protein
VAMMSKILAGKFAGGKMHMAEEVENDARD